MKPLDVYPLFDISLVKGEGCHVWDDKGNKYLDLYGGHAVISIGHNHPKWTKAIKKATKNCPIIPIPSIYHYKKNWLKN